MTILIAPECPTCDKTCEFVAGDVFACPTCGQYLHGTRKSTSHECPVCHLDSNLLHELTEPYSNITYRFYSHDNCFKLIYGENELDRSQFDEEMRVFKFMMTMQCPNCHDPAIILHERDNDHDWVCTECGEIFNNNFVNKKLAENAIAPIKCVRCGEIYNLADGHGCELRTVYDYGDR